MGTLKPHYGPLPSVRGMNATEWALLLGEPTGVTIHFVVPEVDQGVLVAISLILTFTGLLLFSFLIGIGTTIVGELVERSRSQRVGMHDHTVR